MIKELIRKTLSTAQKLLFGYEVEVLTFSQAGEDLIVRNFFYERLANSANGFFVDIGAFHPYRHSNTYYLYRCGWRGVNIDARPGSMRIFDKLRPRDINLEIAISDSEGEMSYFDFGTLAGMNTMSEEYIEKLGTIESVKQVIQVKTSPLNLVLEKLVPEGVEIDFMSIDIEGLEVKALTSNDWDRFRPKLIACEIYGDSLAEISIDPVSCLLASNGYEIYARVILAMPKVNTIFFTERA